MGLTATPVKFSSRMPASGWSSGAPQMDGVEAQPLSGSQPGEFRTCLASLIVTEFDDDAHSSMSAADVATVLYIAHTARFDRVWIAGGWGVDALVGRQTRIHSDLDLAVDVTRMALDHLLQAFGRHGYVVDADWRPSRVALVAGARQVDLHPLVFDAQGTGWQANVDG